MYDEKNMSMTSLVFQRCAIVWQKADPGSWKGYSIFNTSRHTLFPTQDSNLKTWHSVLFISTHLLVSIPLRLILFEDDVYLCSVQ